VYELGVLCAGTVPGVTGITPSGEVQGLGSSCQPHCESPRSLSTARPPGRFFETLECAHLRHRTQSSMLQWLVAVPPGRVFATLFTSLAHVMRRTRTFFKAGRPLLALSSRLQLGCEALVLAAQGFPPASCPGRIRSLRTRRARPSMSAKSAPSFTSG